MSTTQKIPVHIDQRSIAVEDALTALHSFDHIIDVRSPSEFAHDHIPGAISAPVLDDEQRTQIGTLHKQDSAFAAKRRGAALVARNIAAHIEQQFHEMPRSWRPLVYCWRGGQRSGAMAHVLGKVGWRAVQLEGGYRSYRRSVITDLDTLPTPLQWRVLTGTTGSGKSQLLQYIRAEGGQVLDLEALAQHRGSVLGGLPTAEQPSQKKFESLLWSTLRSLDPAQPVFVESESAMVGALRVPKALLNAIRKAPCYRLALPMQERIRLLRDEYAHYESDPNGLMAQLSCLTALHGHKRIAQWIELIHAQQWTVLVEALLNEHYDPAYTRSIKSNFERATHATPLNVAHANEETYRALAASLLAQS